MRNGRPLPDVLTLDEAADYLRLPKDALERAASQGRVPGRQIEDTWRFLKAAMDDWLRRQDSRTILLQQAGTLSDDETLTQLRTAIYAQRGRPETEVDFKSSNSFALKNPVNNPQ